MIFDPFEEIRRIQERLNRLFEDFERIGPRVVSVEFPVDVIDEEDRIRVVADLPGFNKEDIEIWVEDGDLVIKAERKEEREEREANYLRRERRFGRVYRRIALPTDVDIENIKASYNNGVLEVIVPKTEKAKKKVIKIE
ncbi:Hsp20/alpha crystallin family protein [Archaeoglobus sp.]